MQTLWLAIFLYSVGLGIVLQVRPSLMFQTNGAWKEFGYQRGSRYTLMPVWLFAIVWAIVSYAIASAIGAFAVGGAVVAAYNYEEELPPPFEEVVEEVDFEIPVSQVTEPARRPRGRPRKTPYPSPFPSSNNFVTSELPLQNQFQSATQFLSANQTPVQPQTAVQATQVQTPVQPQTAVQPQPQPRPGYYVLDPTSETNGLRRYIYFGSTPPPDAKDVIMNNQAPI